MKVRRAMAAGLALAILLVVASVSAWAGYLTGARELRWGVHQVRGMLRVEPIYPYTYLTSEYMRREVDDLDWFAAVQVRLLRERRTLEKAFKHEAWRAVGRPFSENGLQEFMGSFAIHLWRQGRFIEIVCHDRDPHAAAAGVRALIEAYMELYGEARGGSISNRLNILEQRRNRLRDEIASLENEASRVRRELGGGDDRWIALQREMTETRLAQVDRTLQENALRAVLAERDTAETATEKRLGAMRAEAEAEAKVWVAGEQQLAKLRAESAVHQDRLTNTEAEIDLIDLDAMSKGRVTVVTYDASKPD